MENQNPTYPTTQENRPLETPPPPPDTMNIGPKTSYPTPRFMSKRMAIIFLGIIAFIFLSSAGAYFLGKNSVLKELNPTQPETPPPGPVFQASPTPAPASNAADADPTNDWTIYSVDEIGLEYKLPPDFPSLNKTVAPGDTGKQIYISAGNTKQYVGPITLGTTSFDYTQGRGGQFVDLQGYTKQGSNYYAKFVSGKSFEISQGLAEEITNKNNVKILKVMGKNFESDPNGLPESGTPGEGNIGALINTTDTYFTGFAIDMELSQVHSEKLFDQILSTFKFTQ